MIALQPVIRTCFYYREFINNIITVEIKLVLLLLLAHFTYSSEQIEL